MHGRSEVMGDTYRAEQQRREKTQNSLVWQYVASHPRINQRFLLINLIFRGIFLILVVKKGGSEMIQTSLFPFQYSCFRSSTFSPRHLMVWVAEYNMLFWKRHFLVWPVKASLFITESCFPDSEIRCRAHLARCYAVDARIHQWASSFLQKTKKYPTKKGRNNYISTFSDRGDLTTVLVVSDLQHLLLLASLGSTTFC